MTDYDCGKTMVPLVPGRLTFGVEEERFLLVNGRAPTVNELNAFLGSLQDSGLAVAPVETMGGPVSQAVASTPHGPIVIKHEFCTHILEIAYPPAVDAFTFVEMFDFVWDALGAALRQTDFQIESGSVLPRVPRENQVCEVADLTARVRRLLNRPLPRSPLAHSSFLSAMAATQVHFNLDADRWYRQLADLYAHEYLFPLLFSNGSTFNGETAHCIRPLVYRGNFTKEYHAVGIPNQIPTSRSEYVAMCANPLGLRDYTFIRPRSFGTMEFRSACAQERAERLLAIVALRVAILHVVGDGVPRAARDLRAIFDHACRDGEVEAAVLRADRENLARVTRRVPASLRPSLAMVLDEMVS